jgi:sterol desaturase/sphingolipid hydroxylase (fatty acid hydroxylase superfamily)
MQTWQAVLFGACVAATAAEALVAFRDRQAIYRADELKADLSVALLGFGVLALHRGAFLALYTLVHRHLAFWKPEALPWLVVFVGYDLLYYVDHRSTHSAPLLWISHRVHHQTRAYHLLTGLRMSAVGPLLGYPFRLPLALLGVPPALYVSVDIVHALWTYFLHARFVPRLGPVDWIFNTPAHHRLHHSAEPAHFGKNYGGALLVWDRLFGTYAPPEDVQAFGDGDGAAPLGPVRAHVDTVHRYLRGPARQGEPSS